MKLNQTEFRFHERVVKTVLTVPLSPQRLRIWTDTGIDQNSCRNSLIMHMADRSFIYCFVFLSWQILTALSFFSSHRKLFNFPTLSKNLRRLPTLVKCSITELHSNYFRFLFFIFSYISWGVVYFFACFFLFKVPISFLIFNNLFSASSLYNFAFQINLALHV